MSDWQPIETAPLTGRILVWHTHWNECWLVESYGESKGWWCGDYDHTGENFSHWHPLPPSPTISTPDEDGKSEVKP